jgi:predicted DNA-binding ribbon-helix-helix protein
MAGMQQMGVCMKSSVVKRSVVVAGHKTSVSLEDAFWGALKEMARDRHLTLSDLVGSIDSERERGNLSSALRVFVLGHYTARVSDLRAQVGKVLNSESMSTYEVPPLQPGRLVA